MSPTVGSRPPRAAGPRGASLAQPVRQHAAGRAGADDHVVEFCAGRVQLSPAAFESCLARGSGRTIKHCFRQATEVACADRTGSNGSRATNRRRRTAASKCRMTPHLYTKVWPTRRRGRRVVMLSRPRSTELVNPAPAVVRTGGLHPQAYIQRDSGHSPPYTAQMLQRIDCPRPGFAVRRRFPVRSIRRKVFLV